MRKIFLLIPLILGMNCYSQYYSSTFNFRELNSLRTMEYPIGIVELLIEKGFAFSKKAVQDTSDLDGKQSRETLYALAYEKAVQGGIQSFATIMVDELEANNIPDKTEFIQLVYSYNVKDEYEALARVIKRKCSELGFHELGFLEGYYIRKNEVAFRLKSEILGGDPVYTIGIWW